MPRTVRCSLIQASNVKSPTEASLPEIRQAMIDKHLALIDEAARRRLVLMVDHTFVYTDAVRKIAATGKYLDPEMAERLAFASSSADVDDVELTLSEREMQIFRLIVEGKCIKAIANELGLDEGRADLQERLVGEHGRSFRDGPDGAGEAQLPEELEELGVEPAEPAEVADPVIREFEVLQEVQDILEPR